MLPGWPVNDSWQPNEIICPQEFKRETLARGNSITGWKLRYNRLHLILLPHARLVTALSVLPERIPGL